MILEAREYLRSLVARVYTLPLDPDDESQKRLLISAAGVIEAMRRMGDLTDEQATHWAARLAEAAASRPPESEPALITGLTPAAPSPESSRGPAVFQRLVAGPVEDLPFLTGSLRIIGVELYDEYVVVQWRFVASSSPAIAQAGDGAENDLSVSFEEDDLPFSLRVQRSIQLADDTGGVYHAVSGHTSGHPEEIVGREYFTPAVPEGASRLLVRADDVHFEVPLRSGS
jgi:hypothetical protein